MHSNTLPFIRRKVHVVTSYDKSNLPAVLKRLADEKRSGSLTLHMTNGAVGAVEWNESEKSFLTERQNPV